jgi:hypothetical protein
MARSVGRTDGRRGSPKALGMTSGLHRRVSFKLVTMQSAAQTDARFEGHIGDASRLPNHSAQYR